LNILDELKSVSKGLVQKDEPMARHTYYGIGGPALAYITPRDAEDLSIILKFGEKNSLPIYFIGSGSNILVSDSGIHGLVIRPPKLLKELDFNGNMIFAESGLMLGRLVRESIKRNLTGLESLVGVPGTLGGALVMNAGAFGGEISNYLKYVEIMKMDGTKKTYAADDIDFSYRFSSFKSNEFILSAIFELRHERADIINKKRQKANAGRKTNQPLKYRSAGSVFKNPKDYAAGYLIDEAGLKGTKVGNAEISDHHANFFINHGNASAMDIAKLIKLTKKTVYKKFDVELELEIKTLGFEPNFFDINE